jgi:hypothetical protein
MEDIPEGEQVLTGTFSLNGHPNIVLFDFGATHDFISKACTKRCQLVIQHIYTPDMILTPGGKIFTKKLVVHTPLNLAGKVYKTSFIVLYGQGIDVILDMSWMKAHKALLDIIALMVHLDSPVHGVAILQLAPSPVMTSALHHIATLSVEDIPVAREFPDVFLDDLSGMLPDRDVEFTIEL